MILGEEIDMVAVDELIHHPANPRTGDVGAIVESIRANGFYGALVVQQSTCHVLVGNHRLKAAKIVGIEEVPVIWVDVDDDRALRILLADNRTNDLASYDTEGLAEILQDLVSTPEGLVGTGYDGEALDEILQDLEEGSGFLNEDEKDSTVFTVMFPSEGQYREFLARVRRLQNELGLDSPSEMVIYAVDYFAEQNG